MNSYLHENIGYLIDLTPKGDRLVACCPFHDEKTPSFTVNPANNTYHCFGCDAHGHVSDFEAAYFAGRN